jgi:flagellar motor switch protein FliG
MFLVALGPEISAEIFKHLREDEIERLTLEIARLPKVEPKERDEIMQEFNQIFMAQNFISQGGVEYAREILERAYGPEKAAQIMDELLSSLQVKPFDFIRKTDTAQLLNFIQREHPQTIALILSHLPASKASEILTQLSPEIQADVTRRIATMDRTPPEVLHQVERTLEKKLASFTGQEVRPVGGVDAIVEMLNLTDRATEKGILENLSEQDPELVEEIKRKLFTFEDINLLDDRSLQRVLREVDTRELAVALKGVDESIKEKIFSNMPKRAAGMLKEEMDYLGPVRAKEVEENQQKIVNIIRQLEDSGEIIISRGGKGEQLIV